MSALPTLASPALPALGSLDPHKLFEQFRSLIEESQAAQWEVDRITNQGFLGRFLSSVSGKTGRALARAQVLQSDLQEAQIELAFLNLQLVAQLKAQQDTIDEQQHDLAEANDRLEAQQSEIQKTTANVEKQQATILKLLKLSAEEEKRIREVVQSSDYIKSLEEGHDARIDALGQRLEDARIDVGKWVQRRLAEEAEAHEAGLRAAVAEEAAARVQTEKQVRKLVHTQAEARASDLAALREALGQLSRRAESLRVSTHAIRTELGEAVADEAAARAEVRDALRGLLRAETSARRSALMEVGNEVRGVQRRLADETDALQSAIRDAATAESEARTGAEARLRALLTTERAEREKAVSAARTDAEHALSAVRSALTNAEASVRRGHDTLADDYRALKRAHGELAAQHGGLVAAHGTVDRFARRVVVATGLALVLSIVALLLILVRL